MIYPNCSLESPNRKVSTTVRVALWGSSTTRISRWWGLPTTRLHRCCLRQRLAQVTPKTMLRASLTTMSLMSGTPRVPRPAAPRASRRPIAPYCVEVAAAIWVVYLPARFQCRLNLRTMAYHFTQQRFTAYITRTTDWCRTNRVAWVGSVINTRSAIIILRQKKACVPPDTILLLMPTFRTIPRRRLETVHRGQMRPLTAENLQGLGRVLMGWWIVWGRWTMSECLMRRMRVRQTQWRNGEFSVLYSGDPFFMNYLSQRKAVVVYLSVNVPLKSGP